MATILLVEDDPLNREMFSRRLERKGFHVLTAADGRDAVHQAQAQSPDLILMDMSLPVLDGWEATRLLKADPRTCLIPILALTAHALLEDRDRAIATGCDAYETKPVDLARLLGKVEVLLARAGVAPPLHKPAGAARPPDRPAVPLPAPAPMARTVAAPGATAATILVVDDNQLNRDLLARRLAREGYSVVLASDGHEAIACVARQHIDLVLLDLMMPRRSGTEVLSVLRASRSPADLPVIVVTARDQSADMVAAFQLGANDYVTKPFRFPVLLGRLQAQLLRQPGPSAPQQGETAPKAQHASSGGGAAAVGAPRKSAPILEIPSERFAPEVTLAQAVRSPGPALAAPTDSGDLTDSSCSGDRPFVSRSGSAERFLPPRRGSWQVIPEGADGAQLAGYEIIEEIGRGGMGIVYKARHVRMNRVVALKIIDKEHLVSANVIERFYREIQAAAQLAHPNIVMAYDAGQFGATHYFAMEYIRGVDLNRLVKEHGPLPVEHACSLIAQAASGLEHAAERGLVHRDIKPSNLLLTWNGAPSWQEGLGKTGAALPPLEKGVVKILDLGLALLYETGERSEAACSLTRDGRVVGTADYMAPEQWMNAHKVDVRADLYALGGTFYYLLTGQVPFPGAEPMEKMLRHHLDEPAPADRLRQGLPPAVLAVLRKLLAKKPQDRFQQPSEVVAALEPLLAG